MKNDFFAIGLGWLALIIFILASIILSAFLLAGMRPTFMYFERETNQQSQQYVESTQTRLYQLARKYDDLQADIDRLSIDADNQEVVAGMRARQESLLAEIQEEAGRIPADEIPTRVKQLLEKGN